MPQEIDHLTKRIADIKWLLKLRALEFQNKLPEIITANPCRTNRIISTLWVFSDQQLKDKLAVLEEKLTSKINIDDLYDKGEKN